MDMTKRFYRVKGARREFLCALCRAPRQMRYSSKLAAKNYAQLLIFSLSLVWMLFPWFGIRSTLLALAIWPCVEFVNKLLYRKEISCPYCGFDATWYRRDVRVARRKVEEFWKKNHPELVTQRDSLVSEMQNPEAILQQEEEVAVSASSAI